MSGIMDFWRGYKTKILAFLINVTALAFAMEWINGTTAAALTMFFGGGALATLRQGITTEVATVMNRVNQVDARVANVAPTVAHAVVTEVKAVVADTAPSLPHRTDAPHVIRP